MLLRQLSLNHYRNIESLELNTDSKVNIFVGANAQGKTNLLESIYVLALTKSHRTHQEKELIGWEKEDAHIQGKVQKKYGDYTLDLTMSSRGKRAGINGLEQKKLSEFIGTLNVVMFAPEDLNIVKGTPGIRRRFLDMEIGQIHPGYLHHLLQYQRTLVQRNNYLKNIQQKMKHDPYMLDVWNEQLVQSGTKIIQKRQDFIKNLQHHAQQIHAGITDGKEEIRIEYKPSFDFSAPQDDAVLFEEFMVKLSQAKEQEIRRGMTLYGPHRDDMMFYINGKEVYNYGSQGQQRTTALSLKLAEIEFIHDEVGEYPLLLLDDVLSELDQYRQNQLIDTFQNKVQTFITTTGIENIRIDKLPDVRLYHVSHGQVTVEEESE